MTRLILFLLIAVHLGVSTRVALASDAGRSAVVVMYHRFGENQFPSTNIRIEQFEEHLRILQSEDVPVLPLSRIIDRLSTGETLPDRAVAITVDDAYKSVMTEAWPRLKAAGYPMTLFVSTDMVDAASPGVLSWDDIRQLADEGMEIAHHTASHAHLTRITPEEVVAELDRAAERFKSELGHVPALFAYPYGEASLAVREAVRAYGFKAAFGQHSGPTHAGSDFHYLPRFALNERYGETDRFNLAIGTLPIPATDISPKDMALTAANNPPQFGFTLTQRLDNSDLMNCFASHLGQVAVNRLGENRVEVRFDKPFPTGRGRINCTVPATGGGWRWIGTQFVIDPQ